MSEMTHAAVHEAPKGFIRKWIFSLDHKVIGIQYYFLALFSVFLGMALSVIFCIEHALLLGDLCQPGGHDRSVVRNRGRSHLRLHGLCSAQRTRTNCWAWAGARTDIVDYQHRHFLCGLAPGSLKFHYDSPQ